MKQKDLVLLVITSVILLASGYVVYTQLLAPKSRAAAGAQVEVIGTIDATLPQDALNAMSDPSKTVDDVPQIDLNSVGNPAPFGQ